MRQITIGVLLACLLLWSLPEAYSLAQGTPPSEVSEADFWALINDIADGNDSESDRRWQLDQLRKITTVTTEQSGPLAVDGAALADDIEERGDGLDFLDDWLALHNGERAAPQPDAPQTLAEILSRPEFTEVQQPDLSFLERLWRPLASWFFNTFRNSSGDGWSIVGYIAIGLFIAAVVFLLWYWLRKVRRQFSAETALPFQHESEHALSSGDALQQARGHASLGNFREAVRFLYISTLVNLDERDLLRYDRSKTNREYLRQVAGTSFASTLGNVVDVFDRVWYGFQPIDAETYRSYEAQVEELQR